jgi:hypothetical protein
MVAYENDILTIPEKYKRMSIPELEREEKKILENLLSARNFFVEKSIPCPYN